MLNENIKELEEIISKDYQNIASITVLKDGKTIYAKAFGDCHIDSPIHIYSVTKSIVSLLIGIAIDKGYIQDVNQKVLSFFPSYAVNKNAKTLQDITLENLLTMSVPYRYWIPPYIKYFKSEDWVRFSLDAIGGRGKIGTFQYAPLIGPDILSGILVNTTHQSVLDFARENLFSPLGITVKENIIFHTKEEQLAFNNATNISGWVSDPKGINSAGWGLTLSATDMAKIGQLYLNDGIWENQQIVSPQWMNTSLQKHNHWDKMDLSYGYLWWIIDEDEQSYAAMGDGGNVIYFHRKKNIVVSIASLFQRKVKDRIAFIKQYIEPICED